MSAGLGSAKYGCCGLAEDGLWQPEQNLVTSG